MLRTNFIRNIPRPKKDYSYLAKVTGYENTIEVLDRLVEMGYDVRKDKDSVRWYKNNEFHREDGPANEINNGTKLWYINGKLHREDGPAIEFINGHKAWYLNGVEYLEEDHNKITNLMQEEI